MRLLTKIWAAFSGKRPCSGSLDMSEVATEEDAGTIIEDKIMECVDLLGQFPQVIVDPRAFDHFRVYDTKAHKYGLREPPFDWMKVWLDAYDREHRTEHSKEILSWINHQPMGC